MKRIFGLLFCCAFLFSLIGIVILIWDFTEYNIKFELSLWFLTFIFYHLDETIINKYGK